MVKSLHGHAVALPAEEAATEFHYLVARVGKQFRGFLAAPAATAIEGNSLVFGQLFLRFCQEVRLRYIDADASFLQTPYPCARPAKRYSPAVAHGQTLSHPPTENRQLSVRKKIIDSW